MELGQTYKLTIEGYDMNGFGVAHEEKRVIFVEGAMENEVVIAKITNVHKKYAFAQTIRILEASPDRIEPACPYYHQCGGCDLLHVKYGVEKKIKEINISPCFHISLCPALDT